MICKNIKWLLYFYFFTNNKKGQYKLHNIDAVKTNQLKILHKYSNCGSIGQSMSHLINAESTIT